MTAVILPEILGAIFSLHLRLGSLMLEAASALQALVIERMCVRRDFPVWAWVFACPTCWHGVFSSKSSLATEALHSLLSFTKLLSAAAFAYCSLWCPGRCLHPFLTRLRVSALKAAEGSVLHQEGAWTQCSRASAAFVVL